MKEIEPILERISFYTDQFVNSFDHPYDLFVLIAESFHIYFSVALKLTAFDKVRFQEFLITLIS